MSAARFWLEFVATALVSWLCSLALVFCFHRSKLIHGWLLGVYLSLETADFLSLQRAVNLMLLRASVSLKKF